MATLKYSRQRESIQNFLKNRKDHPTADVIYANIRELYPNVSLGTVYRNLALLTELGEIRKITTADGGDRFDGNTMPHYHFLCTRCHEVIDVHLDEMKEINELAGKDFAGTIEGHLLQFYGICGQCKCKD